MRLTLWAGFWAFMLDQASKYLVVHWLNLRERGEIDVLSPFLNFRMAWNKGVNFGLLSNSAELGHWLISGLVLAVCVWVFYWISREKHRRLAYIVAGFLIGGVLGNVINRVLITFDLLPNSTDLARWLLTILALAICAWVFFWISREKHGRLAHISAGLLIGGALGNVMDRMLYGAVADFLNMSCCGFENPYSFNIADIAVFAGAFGLIFFAGEKKTR